MCIFHKYLLFFFWDNFIYFWTLYSIPVFMDNFVLTPDDWLDRNVNFVHM